MSSKGQANQSSEVPNFAIKFIVICKRMGRTMRRKYMRCLSRNALPYKLVLKHPPAFGVLLDTRHPFAQTCLTLLIYQ